MHWKDAVNSSPVKLALRQKKTHRDSRLMFRRGTGEIELFSSADKQETIPRFREADGFELEGFDDWSPATVAPPQRKT